MPRTPARTSRPTSKTATSTRRPRSASRVSPDNERRLRPPSRRTGAVVAVIAVAAALVFVVGWRVLRHSDSSPAAWVDAPQLKAGASLGDSRTPGAYRVLYRVDVGSKLETTTTEELSVQRPLNSRLITKSGRPPGKDVTGDQTGILGRLRVAAPKSELVVLALPPDLAATDQRLPAAVADLEAAKAVRRLEKRTIAGRPCQVYRTTQAPQGNAA